MAGVQLPVMLATTINPFSTVFRFNAPLGFTSMLMALSHWIINIGLARSAHPEVALSAWAVGWTTVAFFEAPAVMLRSASLALIRNHKEQQTVFKAASVVIAIFAALPALLTFTPALSGIYRNILSIRPEVIDPAVAVVRILSAMIVASGVRCLFQGLIVRERLTGFITFGMITRLLVMVSAITFFVTLFPTWGAVGGAITFLAGMCTEASVAIWGGRKAISLRNQKGEGSEDIEASALWAFMYPLLATGAVATLGDAMLNAGLARTSVPPHVLPGFSIAFSLSWVITAFALGLHQVVIVFADDPSLGVPGAAQRFYFLLL